MFAFAVQAEGTGCMRGSPNRRLQSLSTEDLSPPDHPIRRIRLGVNNGLAEMDGAIQAMYATLRQP